MTEIINDIEKEKEKAFFQDYSDLSESIQTLSKTEKNPFFNSKYVTLNDILEEAKKVCRKHNFIFIQEPHIDTLVTRLIHKNGKEIECSMPLIRKDMDDPQKLGASLTYMRRYSLTSILGIQEEDDDGNKASRPFAPKKANSEAVDPIVEHEPKAKDILEGKIPDYWVETYGKAFAMKGTDDSTLRYILMKSEFHPKTDPKSIVKAESLEQMKKGEVWFNMTRKRIEKDYEEWMKNQESGTDVPF